MVRRGPIRNWILEFAPSRIIRLDANSPERPHNHRIKLDFLRGRDRNSAESSCRAKVRRESLCEPCGALL